MAKRKTNAQKPQAAPTRAWPRVTALVALVAVFSAAWVAWNRHEARPARSTEFSDNRMASVPFRLPPIHPLPSEPENNADTDRRDAVVDAFRSSWNAYSKHAWGMDEYHPLSQGGSNLLGPGHGIGYTIIDSLDTLIILGDSDGYKRAAEWTRNVNWDIDGRLNVFETTIRVLGGLLSASALIANPPSRAIKASLADSNMFKTKADELAERLLPAFDTPSGVPLREINLATGEAWPDTDNYNLSSLAEATTVQLELKYLAHITGKQKYWDVAEKPMGHALRAMVPPNAGILPIFMNVENGNFFPMDVRLGSRGDSFYEYLVKQYLQTKCAFANTAVKRPFTVICMAWHSTVSRAAFLD